MISISKNRYAVLSALCLASVFSVSVWSQAQTYDAQLAGREPAQGENVIANPPPADVSSQLYSDEERAILTGIFGRDVVLSLTQDEAALLMAKVAEMARWRKQTETLRPERRRMMEEMMAQINDDAILGASPPDPDVIREIRARQAESSKAADRPLVPMELASRHLHHDLASPAELSIRMAPAYVAVLMFLDMTGQPWPVAHQVVGDATAFQSQILEPERNVVIMQGSASAPYRESSMMILLEGAKTPITFRLVGDDRTIDARMTVQIPAMGPNSDGMPVPVDGLLRRDSKIMALLGDPNQDYVMDRFYLTPSDVGAGENAEPAEGFSAMVLRTDDERIFVRAKHKLVSPAWLQTAVSEQGWRIYEVPVAHHFLFAVQGADDAGGYLHTQLVSAPDVKIQRAASLLER